MEDSQNIETKNMSPLRHHFSDESNGQNVSQDSMRNNFYRSRTLYMSEMFRNSVKKLAKSMKIRRKKKRNDDKLYKRIRRLCKNTYLILDGDVVTKK